MNRRAFFKWIPFLPAAMLAIPGFDVKPSRDPHYDLEYGAYKLRFTGWKESQQHDNLVGQWIAYPKDPALLKRLESGESVSIYCSFPGKVEFYQPGYIFDCEPQKLKDGFYAGQICQKSLTTKSTEQEREQMKAEQLRRILTFINNEHHYLSDLYADSYSRGASFRASV